MKSTDNRLEELERQVEDEARRLDRLHPLEAKHAVDLLEQDIRNTEIQIQNIFTDVHTLTEGRYSQAPELHKRYNKTNEGVDLFSQFLSFFLSISHFLKSPVYLSR